MMCYNANHKLYSKGLIILFCLIITSCNNKFRVNRSFGSLYNFSSKSDTPNYSNLDYWAAHPWKKDLSDSLTDALSEEINDTLADVFFVYPTTYTGTRAGWYADINDSAINSKTDYSTILYQASVFNQHCRIFSPRYRQAHISAFYAGNTEALAAFDTAYADIKKSFEYYLENYNNNRPIIIAGHSQGAMMAERLLKAFFDDKPLKKKLVAAYILGWAIPLNYFKELSVCVKPDQVNCFCGWRTYRKGYVPAYIQKEHPISFVTNPLSWDTTHEFVSSINNQGSILRDFSKVVLHTTNARIHNGVLWVDRPKFPGSFLYTSKNYHIGDVNLFYMNLRHNIEERIFAFIKAGQ